MNNKDYNEFNKLAGLEERFNEVSSSPPPKKSFESINKIVDSLPPYVRREAQKYSQTTALNKIAFKTTHKKNGDKIILAAAHNMDGIFSNPREIFIPKADIDKISKDNNTDLAKDYVSELLTPHLMSIYGHSNTAQLLNAEGPSVIQDIDISIFSTIFSEVIPQDNVQTLTAFEGGYQNGISALLPRPIPNFTYEDMVPEYEGRVQGNPYAKDAVAFVSEPSSTSYEDFMVKNPDVNSKSIEANYKTFKNKLQMFMAHYSISTFEMAALAASPLNFLDIRALKENTSNALFRAGKAKAQILGYSNTDDVYGLLQVPGGITFANLISNPSTWTATDAETNANIMFEAIRNYRKTTRNNGILYLVKSEDLVVYLNNVAGEGTVAPNTAGYNQNRLGVLMAKLAPLSSEATVRVIGIPTVDSLDKTGAKRLDNAIFFYFATPNGGVNGPMYSLTGLPKTTMVFNITPKIQINEFFQSHTGIISTNLNFGKFTYPPTEEEEEDEEEAKVFVEKD